MYGNSIHSRMLRFGYQFFGPFLVDWYNRLALATEGVPTDTIYMLGREGWGIVPLFNSLEAIRGGDRKRYIYLHASRALLTHICLSDPQYAEFGFQLRFAGSVREFVESRLCLHFDMLDIPPVGDQHIILPRDTAYLLQLFGRSRGIVETFAKRTRALYGRYLERSGFTAGGVHILSDLGFRGSTQAMLSAMYGYDIRGFYALLDPVPAPNTPPLAPGSVRGLFAEDRSFGDNYLPLDRSLLLETFLTAPFGQISGMQDKTIGDPFLYREGGPAQKNYALIAECLQGAHKFASDHIDLLGAREPLIEDFETFFESFNEAIVDDLSDFKPILTLDDSYYGNVAANVAEKL